MSDAWCFYQKSNISDPREADVWRLGKVVDLPEDVTPENIVPIPEHTADTCLYYNPVKSKHYIPYNNHKHKWDILQLLPGCVDRFSEWELTETKIERAPRPIFLPDMESSRWSFRESTSGDVHCITHLGKAELEVIVEQLMQRKERLPERFNILAAWAVSFSVSQLIKETEREGWKNGDPIWYAGQCWEYSRNFSLGSCYSTPDLFVGMYYDPNGEGDSEVRLRHWDGRLVGVTGAPAKELYRRVRKAWQSHTRGAKNGKPADTLLGCITGVRSLFGVESHHLSIPMYKAWVPNRELQKVWTHRRSVPVKAKFQFSFTSDCSRLTYTAAHIEDRLCQELSALFKQVKLLNRDVIPMVATVLKSFRDPGNRESPRIRIKAALFFAHWHKLLSPLTDGFPRKTLGSKDLKRLKSGEIALRVRICREEARKAQRKLDRLMVSQLSKLDNPKIQEVAADALIEELQVSTSYRQVVRKCLEKAAVKQKSRTGSTVLENLLYSVFRVAAEEEDT